MRIDEKKSQPQGIKDKILENAPDMKNGYVKVKTVL
jgi:Asp-tRNA(Asn)/Glu-tRNA(Gln) amidotransferase C subunit